MTWNEAVSHLLVFVVGVAGGVAVSFFSSSLTELRQAHQAKRQSRRTIGSVRAQIPTLIHEMRKDLTEHSTLREFFVLPSSRVFLNAGGNPTLRYLEEEHPGLCTAVHILENHGYVSDVTSTNTRRYRMSEEFVSFVFNASHDCGAAAVTMMPHSGHADCATYRMA